MRTLTIGLLSLVLCYGCAVHKPIAKPEPKPYIMTEARLKIIKRLWQYRADLEHDRKMNEAQGNK